MSGQRKGKKARVIGRSVSINPDNRFEQIHFCQDAFSDPETIDNVPRRVRTEFFDDHSRTLISENSSPDLHFRYSINPYRGCEHGCAYCYARPGHETLGFGAGVDFESKIMVKRSAAQLLRKELNHRSWRGDPIMLSGVTDCYQPAERELRITRSILEIFSEARQAFSIVTKNALITRDIDLLSEAASRDGVHVFISITTLDQGLTRILEPRTSAPKARLKAVSELSAAGVPVGVMASPVIPGLNDEEVPLILKAAAEAGAKSAATILLRLPLSVRPVFETWLEENLPPEKVARVIHRIQDCRAGALNDSKFGSRMRGSGPYAEALQTTFRTFKRRFGLDGKLPALDTSQFRAPTDSNGQKNLF